MGATPPPVATFALSLGSHRAPWRHRAYRVTGSTHTMPPGGYADALDLIRRRSGSGTCNIESSAPDLHDKLEENKVVYDLKRGDVIFHGKTEGFCIYAPRGHVSPRGKFAAGNSCSPPEN